MLPRTTKGSTKTNQQQQHDHHQQIQIHCLLGRDMEAIKGVQLWLSGMETAMSELNIPMDGVQFSDRT